MNCTAATAVEVARDTRQAGGVLDLSSLEEADEVQSQVNKAYFAVPEGWVTLVDSNGSNREQKRRKCRGVSKKVARRTPSPGPVINRVGSGRCQVKSSRVEPSQGRQADDEQDKQASKQYFKKGVWRVEREGADMCFPYVVHKSCPVCAAGAG